jgi:DNA-directed RNA polymerase specialized sigma24 family protein
VKGNSILDSVQFMSEEVTLAIVQVRKGNTNAFTEIVEHYQQPIVRYLYRMTGDYEVAKTWLRNNLSMHTVESLKRIPTFRLRHGFTA